MTVEYKQSLKEIDVILSLMGREYINKIPDKLIKFIKENMDDSYICNINVYTPINQQSLKNNTRILLSLIYRNYWCSEEKKKELMEQDFCLKREYERKVYEKYSPEKLFKHKERMDVKEEEKINTLAMVEYKENWLNRIINKIKSIFYKT